jgi:ribitol 2-dehydrogenase
MNHPLNGKVVIITGASSGIGAATARTLAGYGCKCVLAARSEDRLHRLASELGGNAIAVPTDVCSQAQVAHMAARALGHFGRIDILFANAGIYIPGALKDGLPEDWAHLMDVNVNGVLRCIHAVLPTMVEQQSGDILVTSSISGTVDIVWEPVYSASKHAIQGLVNTLRRQFAPDGIRVGALSPGTVANELWGMTDEADIARGVAAHTHLTSEDVANAAVFMLSQPPHITIRDLVMLPQRLDL